MRKADYALLAQLISKARADAEQNENCFTPGTPNAEYWRGRRGLAGHIAFDFSEGASVNTAEFLKACGIG